VAEADFSDETLESVSFVAIGPRFAEVIVDNDDPITWPSEFYGALDEAVLEISALSMTRHLADGGLPHVDVGRPGTVRDRHR